MSSIDIFVPKSTELSRLLHSLVTSLPGYAKDRNGRYIYCSDEAATMVELDSPKDILEKTDLDLPWGNSYALFMKHDEQIKKNKKSHYFIDPTKISNHQVIDLIAIKAPLENFTNLGAGIVGISLPLHQASFNKTLCSFLKASEILDLPIDLRVMTRLMTQAMQIASARMQWTRGTELFDYETVKFSLREAQCLHYFLNNYSAEKTAENLHISRKTVETHLARIKEKLQCKDKSQITNKAIDLGFIDLMFMRFS